MKQSVYNEYDSLLYPHVTVEDLTDYIEEIDYDELFVPCDEDNDFSLEF